MMNMFLAKDKNEKKNLFYKNVPRIKDNLYFLCLIFVFNLLLLIKFTNYSKI